MMRGNIIQMEVRSSEDQLLSLFLLIPRQQFIIREVKEEEETVEEGKDKRLV